MEYSQQMLKILKDIKPMEDYKPMEEYIQIYRQIEDYIKILKKKYNNIENYNVVIELNQLTMVTLTVIFTYKKIFKYIYDFPCNIETKYDELDKFILEYSIKFEQRIKEYHENQNDYDEDSEFYLEKRYFHKTIDDQLKKINFTLKKSDQTSD